jgi:hypothetical protein
MILQISITKKSDPAFKHNPEFSKYPVVIGREDKTDVVLPDQAKVVSRKHAKIVNTEGILQLIDLNSANSTFLNGEKIKPGEEYIIKSGDNISVGDYDLMVKLSAEKPVQHDEDQRTMVFTNPFTEDAAVIIQSMKILAAKYALEESPLKDDMLKMSFYQNIDEMDKNDTNAFLAGVLAGHFGINQTIPAAGSSVRNESFKPEPPPKVEIRQTAVHNIPEEKYLGSHFSNSVDVLLGTFIKLIQGFLHFRQEFFGVTIYHTIPTGSLQEIKQYLFSPENSPEEEKKKLSLLEEETKKLLNHQIGLLEGYRESVMEGSKSFLLTLDPEMIEKEYTAKAAASGKFDISKFLPILMKGKILEALKENYQKNLSDPFHIEKKFFRPSFLKGYQSRSRQK